MWEKREIRERQEHIVCPLQAPDHTCNEPKVKIFKERHWWDYEAKTRPIRPTMRPHDDEMIVWWWDYMRHHYLRSKSSIFPFLTKASPTDGRTDGRTDRPTDRPSYRDARTHLKTESSYEGGLTKPETKCDSRIVLLGEAIFRSNHISKTVKSISTKYFWFLRHILIIEGHSKL